MKRALVVLAVLVLSITSCGAHRPASPDPDPTFQTMVEPVWVSKDFTAFERAEIHRALSDWNYAMNGYYQFRIESDAYAEGDKAVEARTAAAMQGVVFHHTSLDEADMMSLLYGLPSSVLAWTDGDRIGIHVIVDRIGTRNLHMVVLHELGHTILGSGHPFVPDTLMYPSVERAADCVDRFTAYRLAAAYHWDWRRLRPCDRPRG